MLRYEALLDAAEALLQVESPDAIGLYQIAERAGVPPASVYHFFPTKEAAYTALAGRFLDDLLKLHRTPIEARLLKGWQDLLRIDLKRASDFYNSHGPAMKILYGGYGGVEARNIDKLTVLKIAGTHYGRLNRIFHVPYIKDPEKKFEIRTSLLDAVWTISVRRHGHITPEFLDESYDACAAYTRFFLPEHLEPRELLTEAVERGEALLLPLGGTTAEAVEPEA